MNILVVEDRKDISDLIKIYLEKENHSVDVIEDGMDALKQLKSQQYHLCILDVMLPSLDGFLILKELRSFSTLPVIMLTAKREEQDKILGLDLGADDYITKPFSALELVSRVNSILRRNYKYNTPKTESVLIYGPWEIDPVQCTVKNNGTECSLTSSEYKILLKLTSEPKRVFTKHQLYKEISNDSFDVGENSVAVHISRLRDKLKDNDSTQYIKTIRGLGYKFEQS